MGTFERANEASPECWKNVLVHPFEVRSKMSNRLRTSLIELFSLLVAGSRRPIEVDRSPLEAIHHFNLPSNWTANPNKTKVVSELE